jgi:putative ABC transport system permease protein
MGLLNIIAIGCLAGLLLGWVLTLALSLWLSTQTGLDLHFNTERTQTLPALLLLIAGSLFACLPAVMA